MSFSSLLVSLYKLLARITESARSFLQMSSETVTSESCSRTSSSDSPDHGFERIPTPPSPSFTTSPSFATPFSGEIGVQQDFAGLFQTFLADWYAREVKDKVLQLVEKTRTTTQQLQSKTQEATRELRSNTELIRRKIQDKQNEQIQRMRDVKEKVKMKLKLPEFVRFVDRVSFVAGVGLMLLSEYVVLMRPDLLVEFYSVLTLVLMVVRYFSYHALKFHYFMIDFCYFAQVLLVYYIWVEPSNHVLFQAAFSIANGPLLGAIIMWSNSLVFHDWDKVTSIFIHVWPALVTYGLRWSRYPPLGFLTARLKDGSDEAALVTPIPSWWNLFFFPLIIYLFWQLSHSIFDAVWVSRKIQQDPELMTSLRWFTMRSPHPIYKFVQKKGWNINGNMLLIGVQLVYTVLMLLPTRFFFASEILHSAWICFVIMWALWMGATYYFERFAKTYIIRLDRQQQHDKKGTYVTTWASVTGFLSSFAVFLLATALVIDLFGREWPLSHRLNLHDGKGWLLLSLPLRLEGKILTGNFSV
eukprot:gb/GEZN01005156.1/.p1 GENE.gb/GEZN01005156.1/~~gb/GEZN01005156.1/.p1  ORF type:complete len:527 (-),score=69.58 gb/GEZN01005156.1/:186-1766(-)